MNDDKMNKQTGNVLRISISFSEKINDESIFASQSFNKIVMKKILLLLFVTISGTALMSQIENPVNWSFSSKKISDGKYEVHLTANLESGWHTYSQTTPDGGPVATAINFTKNPLLTIAGKSTENGKLETEHDKLFGVDVKQFSNKVDFVQTITVKANVKTSVAGTIKYMVCNDHECLPPKTINFSVALQ